MTLICCFQHLFSRLTIFLIGLFILLTSSTMTTLADDFTTIFRAAKGQTVYFNAWGGDDKINAYIAWAGQQVKSRYDITLKHVKLANTATAVSRILAEKVAGRVNDGTIDIIWINGANFAVMKHSELLQSMPWVETLPNWKFTDVDSLPAIKYDFAEPTEGKESPWGRAQLVFAYDKARLSTPPRSAEELLAYIRANPGRFTFPSPTDFVGMSFLKQILLELTVDKKPLYTSVDAADFENVTAPLWDWLDEAVPHLWRSGMTYPSNYSALRQLLGDGEIDIALSFNPADASAAIEKGELPATVSTYIHDVGTLANVHFLAIPFNASAPQAARVVADFMLSPEAQIRKSDPRIWGDPMVLSPNKLSVADMTALAALPRGVATLSESDLANTLAEPHPSWVSRLEEAWKSRYASGS